MFVSDYTVRALTSVTYLRVSRFLYQAARSATLLERAQVTSDNNGRAGDNGRLSVDSVVDVDSSSSYRYSSSGSVVDANCAGGILSEPNQETNAVSTQL
jgi:2-polyprenyl-3-methyl-5-hydroxy-6-metoxy-1,4-benzoquinol methylase